MKKKINFYAIVFIIVTIFVLVICISGLIFRCSTQEAEKSNVEKVGNYKFSGVKVHKNNDDKAICGRLVINIKNSTKLKITDQWTGVTCKNCLKSKSRKK